MVREAGYDDRRRRSAGSFTVHQVHGVDTERIVRSGRPIHVGAAGHDQAVRGDHIARRTRRPFGRRQT